MNKKGEGNSPSPFLRFVQSSRFSVPRTTAKRGVRQIEVWTLNLTRRSAQPPPAAKSADRAQEQIRAQSRPDILNPQLI